jgi:hypothetical protein
MITTIFAIGKFVGRKSFFISIFYGFNFIFLIGNSSFQVFAFPSLYELVYLFLLLNVFYILLFIDQPLFNLVFLPMIRVESSFVSMFLHQHLWGLNDFRNANSIHAAGKQHGDYK